MNDIGKEIETQIEKYKEQAHELSDMREDVFNVKADITVTAVGILLEKLDDSVNNFIALSKKHQYYDKDLAATLKTTITDAINAFAKIKPPNINIDLKPLQSIAGEISKQNETIIQLVNKLGSNGNGQTQELQNLISTLVSKQISFLEKEFKQFDYSSQLGKISEGVNKNDRVEKLTVKRGEFNLIMEVIPIYKNK